MSGGWEETGAKDIQAVVVTGRGGCRRDVADGSGGVTDGGGGVDGHDGNRDGISWWEDNSENITFGTEPNETL